MKCINVYFDILGLHAFKLSCLQLWYDNHIPNTVIKITAKHFVSNLGYPKHSVIKIVLFNNYVFLKYRLCCDGWFPKCDTNTRYALFYPPTPNWLLEREHRNEGESLLGYRMKMLRYSFVCIQIYPLRN